MGLLSPHSLFPYDIYVIQITLDNGARLAVNKKELTMKATELLKKDHQKVKDLIKKLKSARQNREELLNTIEEEIKIHSQCEEEIFYPAVKEFDSDMVDEAVEEHRQVDNVLAELMEIVDSEDEDFTEKVDELEENLLHHIEEEEGEMFPKAEKELKAELDDLGNQIQALKEEIQGEGPGRSKRVA
jgi:hemerythrin superfamily protein